MEGPGPRGQRGFDRTLLVAFAALLTVVAWRSIRWTMGSDAPIMMYQAMLFNEFDWLPYRDIFDMNMMGSYLSFAAIGRIFGYGDVGLRLADLSLTVLIGGLTFQVGRTFAPRVGVLAACLLTLWWLDGSVYMQLQREVLALAPIAAGTWAAWSFLPTRRRALLTGLGFGFAATIKPDLALGALPLAALITWEARDDGEAGVALAWGTAGVALPLLGMVGLMAAWGILDDFFAGLPYLRLYGDFSGQHVVFETTSERTWYRLEKLVALGGHHLWFGLGITAVAANLWGHTGPVARRLASLLGLIAVFAFYPFNGGHFWGYHWAPLVWSCSLALGTWLTLPTEGRRAWQGWAARLIVLALVLHGTGARRGFKNLRHHKPGRVDKDRSQEIAAYLGKHMNPGDQVQPLDWITWNVAGGLMRARAEAATRFIYDFHFYHHVSDPYIQELRASFLQELTEVRPRYLVEGAHKHPYFRGHDVSRTFPALERIKQTRYDLVLDGDGFRIWERKGARARKRP